MSSKIITALITVSASVVLLAGLTGCGPADASRPAQVVKPRPTQAATPKAPTNCTPGYSPCLPPKDDYACSEINGHVLVTGSDPYWLDKDGDGVGCDA